MHLAQALAAHGASVTVAGGSRSRRQLGSVRFQPALDGSAEIAVAINDARLLPARAKKQIVWFHNEGAVLR